MKPQIFVIHGGNAFNSYEEYIDYLREKTVSLDKLSYHDWKHGLAGVLGEGYEVILPQMPNASNARYLEWKIYFEKFIPLLHDGVVLVGHSLGGIFLVKYLSEEKFPKEISGVFLVAAPFNTATEHPLADFNITTPDLRGLGEQAEKIFLYHSHDDEVVPFSNFERYVALLPRATQRIFADRGHFNEDDFPELVGDIKSVDADSI